MINYTPSEHVDEILSWISKKIRTKYFAGQEEHGGTIWRKPMLKHMSEEVTDLIVYLQTHEMQQLELISLLTEALHCHEEEVYTSLQGAVLVSIAKRNELIQKALNLLLIGNQEGEPEEER